MLNVTEITKAVVEDEEFTALSEREQNQKLMALYAAVGDSAEAIARKLSLPDAVVNAFLNSGQGVAQVLRFQQTYIQDPAQRVKALGNAAVDVIFTIARTADKPETRLKAAVDLADRAMGKAVQVVENRNINFDVGNIDEMERQIAARQERVSKLREMSRMRKAAKAAQLVEAA